MGMASQKLVLVGRTNEPTLLSWIRNYCLSPHRQRATVLSSIDPLMQDLLGTVIAYESAPAAESEGMPVQIDRDLERELITEFATGGELLMGLGVDGRRERIRVAIFRQRRALLPFRDGPMTYAQAYAECFGRPLEMRLTVREEQKASALAGVRPTTPPS